MTVQKHLLKYRRGNIREPGCPKGIPLPPPPPTPTPITMHHHHPVSPPPPVSQTQLILHLHQSIFLRFIGKQDEKDIPSCNLQAVTAASGTVEADFLKALKLFPELSIRLHIHRFKVLQPVAPNGGGGRG